MRRLGLDMNRLLESSSVLRNENMKGAKSFWSMLQENVTNAARRSFVKVGPSSLSDSLLLVFILCQVHHFVHLHLYNDSFWPTSDHDL